MIVFLGISTSWISLKTIQFILPIIRRGLKVYSRLAHLISQNCAPSSRAKSLKLFIMFLKTLVIYNTRSLSLAIKMLQNRHTFIKEGHFCFSQRLFVCAYNIENWRVYRCREKFGLRFGKIICFNKSLIKIPNWHKTLR